MANVAVRRERPATILCDPCTPPAKKSGEAVRSRCSSALCRPLPSTPARSNAEPPDPVVAAPEPQPHAPVARRHTVPAADAGDASRHYASTPAAANVVCPAPDRVEHQHLLGEKEGCIASLPRTPSPRRAPGRRHEHRRPTPPPSRTLASPMWLVTDLLRRAGALRCGESEGEGCVMHPCVEKKRSRRGGSTAQPPSTVGKAREPPDVILVHRHLPCPVLIPGRCGSSLPTVSSLSSCCCYVLRPLARQGHSMRPISRTCDGSNLAQRTTDSSSTHETKPQRERRER
uniref:Uncharacterized protein n=1 Tax=Oryza rufipogon TaxID=4529 RepID=A0A0E0PVC9_ORYRU